MILNILIVFFSLITLIIIHELGHFIVAKRFGVRVDEFGIGLPPRLFGKKFGETLYSINLIPFGAFVRVYGEEGGVEGAHSFSDKPIWQRALILLAGVIAFWIVGIILLSIVFNMGIAVPLADNDVAFSTEHTVTVLQVASDSPADQAGIMVKDIIVEFYSPEKDIRSPIYKVSEIQEMTEKHIGENVFLTIKRGGETFDTEIFLRESPPEDEGIMGVALSRSTFRSYPFFQAIGKGIVYTGELTKMIVIGLKDLVVSWMGGKELPEGTQVVGPIGVGSLAVNATKMGVSYFLQFMAMISIYLAVFNLLPIPALDGGKLLFLLIEKIKGSPVDPKKEQIITVVFFMLLLGLMVFVTIKDIIRLF